MLLDTHVLLWLLDDSPRLGPQTRARIRESTEVFVSPVSHTELMVKSMLERIHVPDDLPERLSQQGLRPLPYSDAHAAAIRQFPELTRHDPFDRMLLAQAAVENVPFVTADARLRQLELPWVVDAEF